MRNPKNFQADLHIHTFFSFDSLSKPEDVVRAAEKAGLSAIAITDHNQIQGALQACDFAKESGSKLQVIIGEEVSTDKGDLLVYFAKRKIEKGALEEVLEEVKRQNAVCSAAHPYDYIRSGIRLESLLPRTLASIHAVEVFNSRATSASLNLKAEKFAIFNGKPATAGSDAHHPSEIGNARVVFEGIRKLDASLLLQAKRAVQGKLSPKHVHLYSRYAVLRRKLGWKPR
ncbi:MAG: PHP domain-containing protein [Candidatus Micrarchaeota archaeon]|nr:PHP domain-containing protein [Candidatus Micrarchaeota archaeon]